MSPQVNVKELLEAGVHFGHQTRRWNPKMRPFIFTSRDGIHIIDLDQTSKQAERAYTFIADTVALGNSVLFVGTKKQAHDIIEEEAQRCKQYYVTNRWLGGMLTNFKTIKQSIDRLMNLYAKKESGEIEKLTKKEGLKVERQINKLEHSLGGIKEMTKTPGALFIVDPGSEGIAKLEARKLGIPIVALIDTNCDPDGIDYPIAGNDDAIRSIQYFVGLMADACEEGSKRREASLRESDAMRAKEGEGVSKGPAVREQKIGGKGRAWIGGRRGEQEAAAVSDTEAEQFASAKAEVPEENEAEEAKAE